ncbi:isoquinoline 1-oxidoreductase, beta subunit [Rhizobiales bacterium GAS113]|nr:isoquinoline 1-oxidoreductase, beta subunit [Rhizobiales bacterium GAS113]
MNAMNMSAKLLSSTRASTPELSRRRFVLAALSTAGGLALAVGPAGFSKAATIGSEPWDKSLPASGAEISAWIFIEPDDSVTLRLGKAEMGQGISTALPMLFAEELGCDFAKIKVEYASANRNLREKEVYHSLSTGGSSGVRRSREFVQQAGASARARLIAAAAKQLGVPDAECHAADGKVTHQASGRSLNFGALAAAAAQITLAREPAIKTPAEFGLVGKPMARLDTPLKVDGTAKFGIDVKVPGMVYAAVAACPVFGGSAKSFDGTAALQRRGVTHVLAVPNGVAVVADRFWRAKEALAEVKIDWDYGTGAGTDSASFERQYRAALDGEAVTAKASGDLAQAYAAGGKVIEAVYEAPHLAHAPMEPLNATAHVQQDRIDVWMGTQNADAALLLAAKTAGMKPEQVFIHNCFLGGGFGRRAVNDELAQAVTISKAIGKPVKLLWTREEDMRHDRYRPQAAIRFRAALGPQGKIAAFEARTAVGSITRSLGWGKAESGVEGAAVEGLANIPYAMDALKVDCILKNTHVPVMFWRSVGSSINAFVVESFMDELAEAAGEDPYRFRRRLLAGNPEFLAVLDTIAEKSGWGKPLAKGRGRGIAIHESFGTIVGEVAEVAVSPKGEVKVERVVAGVDSGHVVNPRHVEMQIESGILYGLTAALFGEITIKDGRVEQSNFDTYQIARMADAPSIETHLVLSGGTKWGGIGEPGTPPIAPAISNAIYAATGRRIRKLPIGNVDLSGHA